jgi:hypothetical protein
MISFKQARDVIVLFIVVHEPVKTIINHRAKNETFRFLADFAVLSSSPLSTTRVSHTGFVNFCDISLIFLKPRSESGFLG